MKDFLTKYPGVKRLVEYVLAIALSFIAARYGIEVDPPAPHVVTIDGKVLAIEKGKK